VFRQTLSQYFAMRGVVMKVYIGIIFIIFSFLAGPVESKTSSGVKSIVKFDGLVWAGCGITKKAFMSEIAKAYESKTGVKIKLQGGGATKRIRGISKGVINIGGTCRALVTKLRERNPMVNDFVRYVTSKEGKDVIRNAGTVPYSDALHLLGKHYRQYKKAIAAGL